MIGLKSEIDIYNKEFHHLFGIRTWKVENNHCFEMNRLLYFIKVYFLRAIARYRRITADSNWMNLELIKSQKREELVNQTRHKVEPNVLHLVSQYDRLQPSYSIHKKKPPSNMIWLLENHKSLFFLLLPILFDAFSFL